MKLVKQDVGIWINASNELPDFWPSKAARFIHTKIPLLDAKRWLSENENKVDLIEWLKPIKDVYVLTEKEMIILIDTAMRSNSLTALYFLEEEI